MARVTVRQLAGEADLDLDEALVTLWDKGFERIDDVDDIIPRQDLPGVQRALGVATAREMQSISYWMRTWKIDRETLAARLRDQYGITLSPNARVLPKGGLRRLRRKRASGTQVLEETLAPAEPRTAPASPFVWNPAGHEREVVPLSVEEICRIHEALVQDFAASGDPIEPPGVRDDHLLRSAASRPETSLNGHPKYPTVESYAAALLHSLVHNHPFHNGNKRTGVVSMLVLLDRNNVLLTCSEQDLFRHVLRVAQHRLVPKDWPDRADREVLAMAEWVCKNSRPIQRGDRVLKWKELKGILTHLGCEVSSPIPGNRIKVTREVIERRLGVPRRRTLIVTPGYRNAGQDVDHPMLTYIRRELKLDDASGYDSAYFYGSDPREPDEFIAEYRTLLRRLAKL